MDKKNTPKHTKQPAKNEKPKKSADNSVIKNEFSVIEAYKTIRTNLLFFLKKTGGNVFITTSAEPSDGKSTFVTNIAISFSQINKKVLVIDCDMRKPRIHNLLDVKRSPGLSNLLAGLCNLRDVIRKTEFENLFVLPSGSLPPNPAELLTGVVMEELLQALRDTYDIILIDTPPVNIVSDAAIVSKYADGVVLIAKHESTTHNEINKAVKQLGLVDAKILGVILNSVDYSKISGGKYSKYYKRYYKKDYSQYGTNIYSESETASSEE